MVEWGLYSVGVNTLELGALVWLLIHLRHSAAPHQAALIEQQRRDLDILRHNVSRMNTDYLEDKHTHVTADAQVWEELRRINARLDVMGCPLGRSDCPLNGGGRPG